MPRHEQAGIGIEVQSSYILLESESESEFWVFLESESSCTRNHASLTGTPRPKLSGASVYWTYTDSVHWVHWWDTGHTLTQYTGPLVYTLYSYTEATLDPLQCMHSVHYSVCPVYTLTDTGIGSGHAPHKPCHFTLELCEAGTGRLGQINLSKCGSFN